MKDLMNTETTMTSLEIAELTGKRHDNVLADIRNMFEELGLNALEFSGACKMPSGQTASIFNLPRKLAVALLSKRNNNITMLLVDKIEDFDKFISAIESFDAPDLPDRFVYAAQDSHGNLKIGISKHPEERVKQINVGNPDELTLVYVAKAVENGYLSEKLAHEKCKDHHIRSEWFFPPAFNLLQKDNSNQLN